MLYTKKPVRIIRSTDANAPQLLLRSRDLCTILKACLVTGFGDVKPLGWRIAFEDMNAKKIVFQVAKVAGSSGAYLSVTDASPNYAILRGHATMEDINTGSPILGEDNWYYQTDDNRTDNYWFCVGHDTAFVFCLKAGGWDCRGWVWLYFGDLPAYLNNNRMFCLSFSKDYRAFLTDYKSFAKEVAYVTTQEGIVNKYYPISLLPDNLNQKGDLTVTPIYLVTETGLIPYSGLNVANKIAGDSIKMSTIKDFDGTTDNYIYVASTNSETDSSARQYGGHTMINISNWLM